MARSKYAQFQHNRENKRVFFDGGCLRSARSYYQKFSLLYPDEARDISVEQILQDIYEQLAEKDLAVGLYYRRTGNITAANLYFNMVVNDWPESTAAQTATQLLSGGAGG